MDSRTLRLLEYDKIREMVKHHAGTSFGKELVARMRPVRNSGLVLSRQQETVEARQLIESHGHPPFGGFHDVRDSVNRADKQGVLTAAELLDVAETAAACRRLRRFLLQFTDRAPLLVQQAMLLGEYREVEQAIDRAIGSTGEVVDAASPALQAARRRVRSLHEDIQRDLQRIISAPSSLDILQETLVTQRNGRFCVPVRAEQRNALKGIVHDISASGQTLFIEPLSVVELGNDLREAERMEEEEVQRILSTLSLGVGRIARSLLASLDAAGRLDLICARALFAQQLDAVAPELNQEGVIILHQARHPLLGAIAVPIDIKLGEGNHSTLVITGPNTGGKTVTLKTVGLLALMAQSGLQIPALPGSRLALFDQIFADIGDEQSIEQSLSTFSSHMTNIVQIAQEAGSRALILLDEVGAGTDPAEGAALAKSVLLEFHERGCRTIATTHYGELKVFAQTTEGFQNASVEFDLETLRPTYRVLDGLPGSSNALAISQRLGLPKKLVQRAKELMGESPRALEQVLKQAEGVRRALDRERTAATRAHREAEGTSERLRRELAAIEQQRAATLARARQQAQEVLLKTRQESNALLDELRTLIRQNRNGAQSVENMPGVSQLRSSMQKTLNNLETEVENLPTTTAVPEEPTHPGLEVVQAGQAVYVRSVGHRGIALENCQGDDEVTVQVGIMQIHVPVSDLEAVTSVTDNRWDISAVPSERLSSIPKELNLLGMRTEEAAQHLDEYLYNALESGMTTVRIIHGYGTGALRNAVHKLLRQHPVIHTFRPGEAHEGGSGATIAEIGPKEGKSH